MTDLHVVVGAQTGSEGKGHVTHRLIRRYRFKPPIQIANIRVAGPNAGHTVVTDEGTALPLRTIPVGVATPGVLLYIAAGSEVDLSVLESELAMCKDAGYSTLGRIFVHEEATLLEPEHIEAETGMHERMGSTGKGIGAARAARVMRTARRVKDVREQVHNMGVRVISEKTYQSLIDQAQVIVIEGTQGYDLGQTAGYYPQCTSSNTRAIDFLAMAGINPWAAGMDLQVWCVARVYPIRVAGNSGPLKEETTWEQLGLEAERTTVTKKVRRVGQFDMDQIRRAVEANGGGASGRVSVALTMVDQLAPGVGGAQTKDDFWANRALLDLIEEIQKNTHTRVDLATTSPNTGVWL